MRKIISIILISTLAIALISCKGKGNTTKDTISNYYNTIEDAENKDNKDGVYVNEYEEGKFILSFYDNSQYEIDMSEEDKSSYVDLNVESKLYNIFEKDDRIKEVKYKVFLKNNNEYNSIGYGTIDRTNYKDIKGGIGILNKSKDSK